MSLNSMYCVSTLETFIMVVDVKTVCAVSVKEEAVLVREVKTIIEQLL